VSDNKVKLQIVAAIISAAAVIVAALITILPDLKKPSPPPTNTPTGTPSPTPIPTDTPTPSPPAVEIVYIEYDPEGPDIEGEYILLKNTTEVSLDLTAWTIEDDDDHAFRFPSFVLRPQATVKVWTKGGQDTEVDLYWGCRNPVWTNTGDTATLKDHRGQTVDTLTYSP